MSKTTIQRCSCRSHFQDETYGQGNRVFNTLKGGEGGRCTVCLTAKKYSTPAK